MKTNLLKFRQTPKEFQTQGKSSPSFWKGLGVGLLIFLGLGFSTQAWAWENKGMYEVYMNYSFNGDASNYTYKKSDNGNATVDKKTLTSEFKITSYYLKWEVTDSKQWTGGQLCYKINNGSTQYHKVPSDWEWMNNFQFQVSNTGEKSIAKSTDPSGNYTFEHWWQGWRTDWGDQYINNGGSPSNNYKFTYTILPPKIKEGTYQVTISGDDIKSGTGTSEDPYIISYGGSMNISIAGTQNHTDANSSLNLVAYYGSSDHDASGTSLSISNITSSDKQSVYVKGMFKNSSANLTGAYTEEKIYYKAEPAYSITVTSNDANMGTASPASVDAYQYYQASNTITASNETGYHFVNWTTDNAITINSSTSASTTLKATEAGTVTANFAENTWAVTTAKGTGIASVTESGTWGEVNGQAISATLSEGYSFEKWTLTSGTGSFTSEVTVNNNTFKPTSASTITATATANTNTKYVVKHFKQNTDGSTYPSEATETENKTGTTDASVTPSVKSYDGFNSPSTQTVTIAGAGTTVVNYYYTRKTYAVNFSGEHFTPTIAAGDKPQGSTVTFTLTPAQDYAIDGVTAKDASDNNVPVTLNEGTYSFTMPNSAVTVTVQTHSTAVTTYLIRFLNYDGTVLQSGLVEENTTPTYSGATPTKPSTTEWNYTFNGWSPAIAVATKAQDYTAQYTQDGQPFTLTVKSGAHGEITSPVSVSASGQANYATKYFGTFTLTAVPATGYHFDGWTCDPANSIQFGVANASGAGAPSRKVANEDPALGLAGQQASNLAQLIYAGNASVTAAFAANTYKVIFHVNGGAGTDLQEQNFTYDVAQNLTTVSSLGYSKQYYDFAGWATTAKGEVAYTDGQSVSNLTTTQDGIVDLYAVWENHLYDLDVTHQYYDVLGKTKTVSDESDALRENAIGIETGYTINASSAIKTGYYHTKWAVKAKAKVWYDDNGTSKLIDASSQNTGFNSPSSSITINNGYKIEGNETLTVWDRWREYSSNVDMSAVHGRIQGDSTTLKNIGIYTSQSVTAIAATGYHFNGWTKQENANYTITLSSETETTNVNVTATSDKGTAGSITANFVADVYNITYKDKGGESWSGVWTGQHPEIHTYDQVTTLANPIRTGYNFAGWHKVSDCSDAVITEIGGQDYTANFTLYADWQPIQYTVEYNGNGSTTGSMDNQDFTYDVAQNLTTNAYARAYTVTYDLAGGTGDASATSTWNFQEWMDANSNHYTDGQSVSNLTSEDGATITMTAHWKDGYINLATPTKTGFEFAGWYDGDTKVGDAGAQIRPTADMNLTAHWTAVHVYLEGRTKVKKENGEVVILNETTDPWDEKLKTIEFDFNNTDQVYYLNTRFTTYELARYFGDKISLIKIGLATGDGEVVPYGCNTSNPYRFTPTASGTEVSSTGDQKFEFRNVESYEGGAFTRRGPVMYKYDPSNSKFTYCAPLLTLTYNGDSANVATMSQMKIAISARGHIAKGLTSENVVYQYKQGDGDWQTWSSDITAEAGTYKLRAIASGNNEFGQAVENVISNEITVTVTTPSITAKVTHVNDVETANPIVRINDNFRITPTVTGVPAGQTVQVCYKWISVPDGSSIQIGKNIFEQVGETSAAKATIDVAGDYKIRVYVSSSNECPSLGIKWDSTDVDVHVKGDEITVYARLDTKITDWENKYVYYWKGDTKAKDWPGYSMSYIGKDSTDYEWYSYNITGYKSYQGGKLLFNDGTTQYGQFQTNNVDMPSDDEFYFIKTAITGGKRDVATDTHINTATRVILTTDTTALYQYVTIALESQGVFFANREEMKYTYTLTERPKDSGATINAKNQFTPDKAGNYTISIRCQAGTIDVTNTFVLRVKENPLTLTAKVGETSTIGTGTTVTVSAEQSIAGTKTFTVIEPGTNSPITFSTKTTVGESVESDSYTMLSSGMYIFGVVLTDNEGKITGKAQDTVTVAAKKYYIKHPFKNTSSVADGDWVWKEMTYNEIDGTYQYKGEDAYFHTEKKANINKTGDDAGGKPEYTIVNPDELGDNTNCIFVYDVTTDKVTVYALNKRLYRIKSICQDNEYFSNAVTYTAEGTETQEVSFFAQKGGALKWQTRATAADNWADDATVVTTTASASGIYTATPTKLQANFALTAYTGDLTVFSQAVTVNSSEHSPTALNGKLTEFTKKSESEYYNHYWVRYVEASTQAMATMGNSINNCIAATLPYYQMPASGNVRYAYDNTTNHFSRTILAGSGDKDFLRAYGEHLDTLVASSSPAEYNAIDALDHSKKFDDGSDWIYTANASGVVNKTQSVTAIVAAKYNGMTRWVLAESGLEADPASKQVVLSKDAAGTDKDTRYNLTLIYDFKTNRLTAGAQPAPGTVVEDTMVIDQLILTREGDESATQFTLAEKAKLIVVDKMTVEFDVTKDMWTAWTGNTQGDYKIMYFWFSVPYECHINEIYGLGVYGEKFEIQRYRGDLRASGEAGSSTGKSAWRKLKATATLEANRGYVIAMRVAESDFKSATVGGVKKSVIRLFFPSVSKVELTHEVKTVLQQNENKATSPLHWNWNIMGNPLVTDGTCLIVDSTESAELNYIYVWNWGNGARTYEPWATDEVILQSTHSYMVQGYGNVYWAYPTAASAPARYLEAAQFASEDSYGKLNLRLNIKQDEQLLDKTYIRYREDGSREEYEMGRDLEKIINSGVTQMYATTNDNLAAICLNSEDKDMIPLTVIANNNGTYSIALHRQLNSDLEPTIYDAETQQYTNLSLGNFTIDLTKGTYENRFFFLLKKTGVVTNLGDLKSNNYGDGVEKIIMNEQLYILRDGKLYNATGSVVE